MEREEKREGESMIGLVNGAVGSLKVRCRAFC
jgi:hypothetical protein